MWRTRGLSQYTEDERSVIDSAERVLMESDAQPGFPEKFLITAKRTGNFLIDHTSPQTRAVTTAAVAVLALGISIGHDAAKDGFLPK